MKRKLPHPIDYLSTYYETKKTLQSIHKRQRIFEHPPGSTSKLCRQEIYAYIDKHNTNIDTQIDDEVCKLVCIVKGLIIDNNIPKLQELVSHGILADINNAYCRQEEHEVTEEDSSNCNTSPKPNALSKDYENVLTDIIGCALQYNREECLLVIAPFLECKYFDVSKFDRPILSDPIKVILFLHSNAGLDLTASHCKLYHKSAENGHYKTVRYCIQNGVPVDSRSNRAVRDAARYGHLSVVQLLHENGANIHEYDEECMRRSARNGHYEVLKYLIEHKAAVGAKHSEALEKSVENGHVLCCDLLIKSGLAKEENFLITNTAIRNRRYECLSLLVKYGYVVFDAEFRTGEHDQDSTAAHDTMDMSPSPSPSSPQYMSSASPMSTYSPSPVPSAISPAYSHQSMSDESVHFEDEQLAKQQILDSISEGLALREQLIVSVLSHYVLEPLAYIILCYEKLALTAEDEMAANEYNQCKLNKYKRKRPQQHY
mmetsp:Transcript_43362/g.71646  ORF Transcript_43362/g.71646 Transcript_43362/m.71646 type:complete len:486 (-) Transcript_43362:99-1556(-)|eukprot:CAMPEP_0202713238 /NCGR_PEP_ID=MMETSP1385-20130828/52267_1 /ASSEMBLY_ACC=CAM_ASM_000861 /TAXON_ID=933848 /ORGANISM="Elphidium margaritaceum" /LENGTH=485 /DNA_ID=CAMNT_0049373525 /DNA_START=122 /DNA_END=1579 /DNA_ORIENTATION=+